MRGRVARRRHWDVAGFSDLRLLDGDVPVAVPLDLRITVEPNGNWSVIVRPADTDYGIDIRGDVWTSATALLDEVLGVAFRIPPVHRS